MASKNSSYNINNTVPIISVTPHSPNVKYTGLLEEPLNQLKSIRESLMLVKTPILQTHHYGDTKTFTSNLSTSCPSLPDFNIVAQFPNHYWPIHNTLNTDRRKSWTAIEDLTECTKNSNKSASLSSVDSEESFNTAERRLNHQNRCNAGGISTHSLNEAELARDFERILAKINLIPITNRLPLQKSISTPSIGPLRNQSEKDESKLSTSRHLSDSEDDTQDDRSLLCVRNKHETYCDLPEKRRKRGSLFFRKKKDKSKAKTQSTTCDVCGTILSFNSYKEHAIECKAKIVKMQQQKGGGGKKNFSNCHGSSHHDGNNRFVLEGHNQNIHSNYSDETPLIKDDFLYDTLIGPNDLGAEAILGLANEEPESWSPSVPKEVVKSLKDKQIKRQEHIYEFIMTEKHHCQTLLVIQKVFVESLQRHFTHLILDRMFPRLAELTELHTSFLKKLRLKQQENHIVDSIADILVEFFSSSSAEKLKSAYGEFCSNHRSSLDTFKCYMTEDQTFAEWYKHCQLNPLLRKKGIPECILFITQRLTKYPLLIDPLLKSSRDDKIEQQKLQKSMALVKEILIDVDARVAEKEKEERLLSIFKKIDAKSYAMYKRDKFKKSDIISGNRKLKFEGVATLMQGRSKMQAVVIVVLSDCVFFLQENNQKYSFFTPENKAGVFTLQKLLIREKAGTESRGIYIISSNPAYPEMYELKVQSPKDKNIWIQSIRAAVLDCPSDELEFENLTTEQKQKLIDVRQANIREMMSLGTSELEDKLRQKDLEQAILLEEKISMQFSLWLESQNAPELYQFSSGVDSFLSHFGSYREIVTDDCDTVEIWKRVLLTVQETSKLASNLYSAATGLPLSRSLSSVGEKQSEIYVSPTLPKRAETFGGFDDKRIKQPSLHWRDAVLSTLSNNSIRENQFKRNSVPSENENNLYMMELQNKTKLNEENISIKDQNFAALEVSHHLHTLLCIISQQMTTIQSLQTQLMTFRESSKTLYRHNDQLEELRNLQDKLQDEKKIWLKQKELEEKEFDERRQQQKILQEQIRAEQEDIKQQREQLYRKMEILSNQGLLLSPSVALPVSSLASLEDQGVSNLVKDVDDQFDLGMSSDRRKEKWRSTNSPKTPPLNLLSATNAPKLISLGIKQQLPLKLSSLSSSKSEKVILSSGSISVSPNTTGMAQLFPLKLADKKNTLPPNHSRAGSSPAVVQQLNKNYSGSQNSSMNTFSNIYEKQRIHITDNTQMIGSPLSSKVQQLTTLDHGQISKTLSPRDSSRLTTTIPDDELQQHCSEEEVLYF